ncbi:Uncharacterised protein [Actinomyces bovis]|uniref:LppM domain-containing protein n=1 Tax=Actinomyces bovis TaxID=1658 RepID=A0ABY1VN73_9ACTO|nr:translation initiation factor 2 [Actinomyces bovis]SPT53550.1 Uncharacterised protein [Actinomyces bovis]VEG55521.1 Uncharacterised protein [Actinomyces israelii]
MSPLLAPAARTAARRRRLLPAWISLGDGVACRARTVGAVLGAAALLAGCTAKLDLEVKASGTFNAVIEMRDTTGTVFQADPDCSSLTNPQALGLTPQDSTKVTAEKLTGSDGSGCLVRISEAPVAEGPMPQAEGTSHPLVVRDGDKFTVKLPPFTAPEPSATATAQVDTPADPAVPTAAPPSPVSLAGLVKAHLQLTFPGAVVDGGGGQVDGRTVTWTDPDLIADGVQATGLAQENAGLSTWDRFKHWITAGVVLTVIVLTALLIRRNRRRSARRTDGDQ